MMPWGMVVGNGEGNGNGSSAAMATLFKVAAIVAPLFTAMTMFGVAYGLTQINEAKRDLAELRAEFSALRADLNVRVQTSDREHARYENRLEALEKAPRRR